jgi:hypothetical protein
MALTNAERQARYIQRLKAAAGSHPQAPPDSEEVMRLMRLIAQARRDMPRNSTVVQLCNALERSNVLARA